MQQPSSKRTRSTQSGGASFRPAILRALDGTPDGLSLDRLAEAVGRSIDSSPGGSLEIDVVGLVDEGLVEVAPYDHIVRLTEAGRRIFKNGAGAVRDSQGARVEL